MKRPRTRLGTVSVGGAERAYVRSVLDNSYLSPGKYTKKFEAAIAEAHGKKYGLALNSGQSAIMVVLEAAKLLGLVHTVAVPAVTYISSIAAVVQAGLRVRLVDVSPDPHAELLWDQIPDECDGVLPCHLFGRANTNMAPAERFVVEDACESIYAKGVGVGDAMCLSFYPSHTITAGFGGMILTDDKDLYFKCWQLVNHGRQDMDDYSTCHTLKERFTFSEWGWSLKFSDLNAAFGYAQHTQKDWILERRRNNASMLQYCLFQLETAGTLRTAAFRDNTFMMFPIIVNGDERDALEKALNDEEIETRRMMPITTQPIIREYFGAHKCDTEYPGAKFINKHGLYVGCHQHLEEMDIEFIGETICKFYGK